MKRALAAFPVVLVVMALLMSAAPTEARVRRVALGIWAGPDSRDIGAFDRFTRESGRRPAIWTVASQWGSDATKDFPSTLAKQAKDRGAALMVTWTPVKGAPINDETGFYSRYQRIVDGAHDPYIKAWAKAARDFGGPVLVRFAHEMNGEYFPWGTGYGDFSGGQTNDNSPKVFVAAWKHLVGVFRSLDADNVKFVWTPAKACKRCTYTPWYPGRKWVDYVGFSNFNWGTYFGRSWQTFAQGISQPMAAFAKFTAKPVIVAELGTTPAVWNGYTKPWWIKSGYRAVRKKYPRIKAIIYQHVDLAHLNHPDWSLDNPSPGAMDAYGEVAANRAFRGRVTATGAIR
jgi:hypothetical protein